jgi:hypothetical protein
LHTLTHLAIATCGAALLWPNAHLLQAACVVGAVLPDVVMVPTFITDRMSGRLPLSQPPQWLLWLIELGHSFWLWSAILLAAIWFGTMAPICFALGGLSHVMIDVLTHGNPQFQRFDPQYLWPIADLRGLATWDYRIIPGRLWPLKPLELTVLSLCVLGTVALWIA